MATLKQQIGETEREIADLTERMEAARGEIVAAAGAFAAKWWPTEARRALHLDSERAAELRAEGLGGLKAEIDGLVDGADDAAEQALAIQSLWPHLGNPHSRLWRSALVGQAIDPALRRLLGRILPILIRHRLKFADRNGRPITHRYPQGVEVSKSLADVARTYHEMAGELGLLATQLSDLERRSTAAEIDSGWKKASA